MGLVQPSSKVMIIFAIRKDLNSSIIETKSTVLVPGILTLPVTDNDRENYQEYHDMAWSYR
jgi:hypothetical protein